MTTTKCCECHGKAAAFVDGKFYCAKCTPPMVNMPKEVCVCADKCEEEPKKKGFWSKVAKWFSDCSCGCEPH
jgi:hypothetical protein